jgi:uncharacterized OB-fold protein
VNATGRPVLDGWLDTGPSPALLGSRCTECGTVAFPPRHGPCPNPRCLALELTTHRLSTTGRVWSYTDAQYQPPAPYVATDDPYVPFALAAVELDDDRIVVLGQVARGCGVTDLRVGSRAELVVEPLYRRDGEDVLVWKWKPLPTEEGGDE